MVPHGDYAYVFYHVNPEESFGLTSDWATSTYEERWSAIQVARLRLEDGKVVCDRDVPFPLVLPTGGGVRWTKEVGFSQPGQGSGDTEKLVLLTCYFVYTFLKCLTYIKSCLCFQFFHDWSDFFDNRLFFCGYKAADQSYGI